MRTPIAAILLAASTLAGPVQAQLNSVPAPQVVLPPQKDEAFDRCLRDGVLWALRRNQEDLDKKRLANEALSMCPVPDELLLGDRAKMDAWFAERMREAEALIEKDAPIAKAQKANEVQASTNYITCLRSHARAFALATDESAEIVAQASLAACPAERQAIFEIYRRYNDRWTEGTQKAMDDALLPHLLLEIVEARAQRNVAPMPARPLAAPQPPKTPI